VERTLFEPEHALFRESVAAFLKAEVLPHYARWERAGVVDREVWLKAGQLGLLGLGVAEAYGGGGPADYRYNAVLVEEIARNCLLGLAFVMQNDVVLPSLLQLGTDEQRRRWLPGVVRGELITAIAMTEPDVGSDLKQLHTRAVRRHGDAGDYYLLNGTKTYISNGQLGDLIVVAARTGGEGAKGISLLVVERGMAGFGRGRNLDKIGMHAQDTSELSFADVRVPVANLLGEEGRGFYSLMANLAQERLSMAVAAVACCEAVLEETLRYVRTRTAFGQPIGSFQNSRFLLAGLASEIQIARVFVDRCLELHVEHRLEPAEAAIAKWWTTELQSKVVDRCLQLHGGFGYMNESLVARAYRDTRSQTIGGGSTEIMKEIIGRSLGL
jgi:alkylation response protein AidB-like acyl-CoA dehydrogenase